MMDFINHNKEQIAGFYFGGDQFDNEEISHHNSNKPLYKPTGQYKKNTVGFDRDILQVIEASLPTDASRVWQIGNHDDWEFQLIEKSPELEGTIERPNLLGLTARGWNVIPCGGSYNIGKLKAIHGEALSGVGNQAAGYHAKKAVEIFCSSIIYGHMHSPQSYTKILPYNQKDKWQAVCAPIMGSTNPGYLRNRPTAWLNGVLIVETFENGNFNVYPVVVSNGRFSFGGKIYGAD